MSLEQELEGVTKPVDESPDVDTADSVLPEDGEGPGDLAASAESDGDGDQPAQKTQGRTVENVRGELLRKLDEENRVTRQMLADVLQLLKNQPAQTQSKKPETLDDLPLDQLETQRGQVPEEKRGEFDAYLTRRRIDEGIKSGLSKVQEEQKYATERKQAAQRAVDLYPQLMVRGTELYNEVNRRLASADPNARKYNPRILLNLAEDVAGELGIAPRKVTPRLQSPKAPSSFRGEKPVANVEEPTASNFDELARKLAPAMKGRKFDKARIAKRTAEYKKQFGIGE